MVETDAGSVELNEAGIPPELLPRARAWFAGQTRLLERLHGPHWPANREWLVDYLQAELRARVADGRAWHAL